MADAGGRARWWGRWRTVGAIAAALGLCLGVVVTRAMWEGRVALHEGDQARAEGDLGRAIARWRRAARWYVPGAWHVEQAYERLEAVARRAELEEDPDTALAAWRGVRSSILATRSFYTPHAERLEPANRRIAALMARAEPLGENPFETRLERTAWHLEMLSRDEAPSVAWSIVALLGLAMWVGGGLMFALRGVTPDDRLVPGAALAAGGLVATGLFLWMLGLRMA